MSEMKRTPHEWRQCCRRISAGSVPSTGKETTYDAGIAFVQKKLVPARLWKAGAHVLEVGSGNGRIAMGLCEQPIRYIGLEPIVACVDFCRAAFDGYNAFQFAHFDVRNTHYNPAGIIHPAKATFPVSDNAIDLVILASVFSHMETTEAAMRYLDEIQRVLRPGGTVYCTWFRSPPNCVTTDARRSVYQADWILEQVHCRFTLWDARGGNTSGHHDQWEMIARKN